MLKLYNRAIYIWCTNSHRLLDQSYSILSNHRYWQFLHCIADWSIKVLLWFSLKINQNLIKNMYTSDDQVKFKYDWLSLRLSATWILVESARSLVISNKSVNRNEKLTSFPWLLSSLYSENIEVYVNTLSIISTWFACWFYSWHFTNKKKTQISIWNKTIWRSTYVQAWIPTLPSWWVIKRSKLIENEAMQTGPSFSRVWPSSFQRH